MKMEKKKQRREGAGEGAGGEKKSAILLRQQDISKGKRNPIRVKLPSLMPSYPLRMQRMGLWLLS